MPSAQCSLPEMRQKGHYARVCISKKSTANQEEYKVEVSKMLQSSMGDDNHVLSNNKNNINKEIVDLHIYNKRR